LGDEYIFIVFSYIYQKIHIYIKILNYITNAPTFEFHVQPVPHYTNGTHFVTILSTLLCNFININI
jgi:hypothetical protein